MTPGRRDLRSASPREARTTLPPMPTDVAAAERFLLSTARLLDRHRAAVLLHGAPVDPVLAALRAYRNPDGGFGHALEPDVRGPESEPTAALHALEVLAGVDALDDPMTEGVHRWVASVALPDGGVPFVLPTTAAFPHAPWMVPSDGGSHLTFALAGELLAAGAPGGPWLDRGTDWCWRTLEGGAPLPAYTVKFALGFLDRVPEKDDTRARAAVELLRPRVGADGTVPVEGGTEDERLRPLTLSPRPGARSRTLFSDAQIADDLDRLAADQRDDGGWTFDWLAWSAGQADEWRGALTLGALVTLAAHGRVAVPLTS
jgi:hypothetical protein